MPSDTRPLCPPGRHHWMFRRYYSGIETFDIERMSSPAQEVDPPSQGDTPDLVITLGPRDTEDYDDSGPGRVELFCTECPATIDGTHITEAP